MFLDLSNLELFAGPNEFQKKHAESPRLPRGFGAKEAMKLTWKTTLTLWKVIEVSESLSTAHRAKSTQKRSRREGDHYVGDT